MKKKFTHLTYEHRVRIEGWIAEDVSQRYMAEHIGCSPNTISYEIKNNTVKGIYTAKKAHHKAYYRRYLSKRDCLKVATNRFLTLFVEGALHSGWSPECISGRLKHYGVTVSPKAIYKYIYHRALDGKLFWSRNNKKTGRKRHTVHVSDDGRRYIYERPPVTESGHYEADFIVSSQSTYVLLVVVDRFSRRTFIKVIRNRKHATVLRAFRNIFKNRFVRTLTLDNDIAFNCWKQIEKQLHTSIYFTEPYCSWQKGLVENMNRWIRVYVPKKRDIQTVTQSECDAIQHELNARPKGCLDYKTVFEVELEESGVLIGW